MRHIRLFDQAMTSENVTLELHMNHVDSPILLDIPRHICMTFSNKPLKWLHYVAYAICGSTGTLKSDDNTPMNNLDDPNVPSRVIFIPAQPDTILLADPRLFQSRTPSTEDSVYSFDSDFKDSVVKRDATCVFTGSKAPVAAAHLIPPHIHDEVKSDNLNNLAMPD